jgi:DNA mismatch repair protein MutL
MPRIRRLPVDTANKIAAGEVVERPASVVKELVENALDAEATRIHVEIDMGGLSRILVSDDGVGMDATDLSLSLERHATSKIATASDLTHIHTFGFRGEALPSIASIAKLVLISRARDSDEGTELAVDGGGPPRARPVGRAIGTSVEVRELFWNVPARLKFLKSTVTESAQVGEAIVAAALARPEVTFTLARDGKVAREYLRMDTRRDRTHDVLSEEHLEPCLGERGPMRFEAYLSAPERARAGATGLHLFVNGRPVKDRQLARSIASAYGSVLEPGRYPVGVFYLELPVDRIDVNVHPQKAEVRFAEGRAVFDAVTRELHATLARAFSLPDAAWSRPRPSAPPGIPPAPPRSAGPPRYAVSSETNASGRSFLADGAPDPLVREWPSERGTGPAEGSWGKAVEAMGVAATTHDLFASSGFYQSLRFIGQAALTFLVCEGADGLYVLDQHAAAERISFARLRESFHENAIAAQRLLIPEVIQFSPTEHALVEEHAEDALRLGLEVRPMSGGIVAVHSVPKLLARANPERLVRDLVAELGRKSKRPFHDTADLVLATMACHGSIRAGDAVSAEEAAALLRALDRVDFGGYCPHGRPVVMRMPFAELERKVGR